MFHTSKSAYHVNPNIHASKRVKALMESLTSLVTSLKDKDSEKVVHESTFMIAELMKLIYAEDPTTSVEEIAEEILQRNIEYIKKQYKDDK